MKLNKRKGFTVVELVIVIAIIAVLAAVLIPTFAGLVRKANISKDTQLVRNLNTALATATEKPKTMHEALQIAADAGYLVDKINASATSNEILYDSKNNVFCYYNATNPSEGSVEYIPESAQGSQINDPKEYYLLWKIYDKDDDIPAAADQKFSVYLADDANVPETGILTVSVGFDAGTNTKVKEVVYKGTASKVIFNLNGGKLTVNDKTDSNQQYFYGSLSEAVVSTGNSCFHAYGTIAKLDLKAGTVIAKKNSILVVDSAAEGSTVKKDGGIVMAAAGKNLGENVAVSDSTEKENFALEISDAAGLAAFRDSVNAGMTYAGLTVKLTADIDLSTQGNWNPIGNRYALNDGTVKDTVDGADYRKAFKGTFDGQGHTISGMFIDSNAENYKAPKAAAKDKDTNTDTSSYAALFGCIDGATLKNFTVKGTVLGTDVAGVVGITGANKCQVEQITSYVNLTGKVGTNGEGLVRGKVAGIVNCPKGTLVVSDCTNRGDLTVDGTDPVGGIIAYIGDNLSVTIENCNNYGEVSAIGAQEVGGVVGSDHANTTYKNCNNYGKITGDNRVGGIAGTTFGSFEGCNNDGIITATECAGGIVGKISSVVDNVGNTLTNCKNSGAVMSKNMAGGLVGYAYNTKSVTVTFTNCENTSGSITGTASNVGEIVGQAGNYHVKFNNCKGVDNKALIGTASQNQVQN